MYTVGMTPKKDSKKIGRSTVQRLPKLKVKKPKKKLDPDDPRMLNLKKGKPFEKGFDPRRNLDGPPKNVDYIRKFVQELLDEEFTIPGDTEKGTKEKKVHLLRNMILGMALGNAAADHIALLQYGYGKIPDEIVFTVDDLKKIIDYLPPDMVERIAKGDNIVDIIIEVFTSYGFGSGEPKQP